MLKKLIIIKLVSLLVFICIGMSYAAEEEPGAKPGGAMKGKSSKGTRIYGVVLEVTDNTLKISLEKGAAAATMSEISVMVNEKTKVRSGKEAKTPADIKADDRVRVWYKEQDGKNVASSVQILKPKKGKAKKEEMKKEEMKEQGSQMEESSTEKKQN
jgi:hypothetical protein